jgi:hypothetical protein
MSFTDRNINRDFHIFKAGSQAVCCLFLNCAFISQGGDDVFENFLSHASHKISFCFTYLKEDDMHSNTQFYALEVVC